MGFRGIYHIYVDAYTCVKEKGSRRPKILILTVIMIWVYLLYANVAFLSHFDPSLVYSIYDPEFAQSCYDSVTPLPTKNRSHQMCYVYIDHIFVASLCTVMPAHRISNTTYHRYLGALVYIQKHLSKLLGVKDIRYPDFLERSLIVNICNDKVAFGCSCIRQSLFSYKFQSLRWWSENLSIGRFYLVIFTLY